MKNVMFVLSGNCRTFIHCIDSIYKNVIISLFPKDATIYIYMYLKLTDPGPKGQSGFNYEYKDNDYETIVDTIHIMKSMYSNLNIEYKLLHGDEISDNELLSQVKDRRLYNGFFSKENIFLRGLHCHYNLEKCGQYILEKERSLHCKFDYIIYVRPDLYFTGCSSTIESYNTSIITLGNGPNDYNNDHIAIVPRQYLNEFFFTRMATYRNNTEHSFISPEEVYWHTIIYEVKPIGTYYIKRS